MDQRELALSAFVATASGDRQARLSGLEKLAGGAIQENWSAQLTLHGAHRPVVIRTDAPSGVAASRTRAEEFHLLKAAHGAGVAVPEPLWLCTDPSVIGKAFFVMARVAGTAAGHQVVKDPAWGGDRTTLAERLGAELARIHAVVPPRPDLDFLGPPPAHAALDRVATYRDWLDAVGRPHAALEWGLRWLERLAPDPAAPVLTHRDYRTGNVMLDQTGITGVLDWEFAAWGDPMEDLGWFCARCWRFGVDGLEAGGLGARADFYGGYASVAGRPVDDAAVRYWEVMAHVRWAVIALQQGERVLGGGETNLEAALTATLVPQLELEILRMTKES
ncbi:MAG: phosphotransferase family protein [Rhodobacterales bacterium]|nr:phosphotransferase family protein [Rhodobacterales bacterium]